jgi:hypothetical protein
MKINQKIAGGASAIKRIHEIARDSDCLNGDIYNLVTSAEIVQNSVELMFRDSDALRFLKDERFAGYHLISSDERRHLSFQVDDTAVRSRALEKIADHLSAQLFDLRDQMKEAASASPEPEFSGVDTAFAEWRSAYDAWAAANKGTSDQFDTPEGLREKQALIALAQHPCASLEEVRRKADLFQTDRYLSKNSPDLVPDLLRSFAEAGGE